MTAQLQELIRTLVGDYRDYAQEEAEHYAYRRGNRRAGYAQPWEAQIAADKQIVEYDVYDV